MFHYALMIGIVNESFKGGYMNTLEQLKQGDCLGLTRLSLAEGLTEFPTEIYTLADTLEVLDLSNNQLKSLPNDFNRLHKLKILFASNNSFEILPEILGACTNLRIIGFKANQITQVPENALPINLQWLILTDNAIAELPASIGRLGSLKKLMLAGNKLKSLPSSLENCQQLQLLRISANAFNAFPEVVFKLPHLAWLAFAGNAFEPLSPLDCERVVPEVSLDDLQLHEKLGDGASGEIYRATWLASIYKMPKQVAIKVYRGAVTSDGYAYDELAIAMRVGMHANLVRSLAYVHDAKTVALVMGLIPAGYRNLGLPPSLESCTRDTFEQGRELTLAEVAKLAAQMESVLAHLRARQISHGDLYAHNVLVDENAQMLLGDFGAAAYYGYLPFNIQQGITVIEKRALGYFIDDLLRLCVCDDAQQSAFNSWQKKAYELIDAQIDN